MVLDDQSQKENLRSDCSEGSSQIKGAEETKAEVSPTSKEVNIDE